MQAGVEAVRAGGFIGGIFNRPEEIRQENFSKSAGRSVATIHSQLIAASFFSHRERNDSGADSSSPARERSQFASP